MYWQFQFLAGAFRGLNPRKSVKAKAVVHHFAPILLRTQVLYQPFVQQTSACRFIHP